MLRLRLRGNVLWVMGRLRGQRVRKSTGVGEEHREIAQRMLDQITADIYTGAGIAPKSTTTWSEASTNYKTRPEGISRGTLNYVRMLDRTIPADLPLAAIATIYVNTWVRRNFYDIAGAPRVKPATIHRALVIFRAVLRYAHDGGLLAAVPKFNMPKGDEARDRYLKPTEVERLIEAAQKAAPWMYPLILFLVSTGARLSEALVLEQTDIDFENGLVRLRSKKGGRLRWRDVPMTKRLEDMLRSLPPSAKVFTNFYGEPFGSAQSVYHGWKITCQQAELENLRPHDLRRTYASNLVMRGVDLPTLQKLLGHTSPTMLHKHYAHLASDHMVKAMERLPW